MQQEDSQPWYKQFWPWFLISIPLASIVGGISMIIISIDGADTLVNQDYYKDGLAINKQFDKIQKANTLGISATIDLIDNKIVLDLQSKEVISDSLALYFNHATMESKDFKLNLQQASDGKYFSFLEPNQVTTINGKWYLQLIPYSDNWKLESSWTLPNNAPLIMGK